jgi:hypothetical protein
MQRGVQLLNDRFPVMGETFYLGEIIKNEEIDKEFSRRFCEYKEIMNVFD